MNFRRILQHRVTKNAGALVVLQIVTYVTPLIVLIYLTRVLGLETYGVVAFGFAITQIASVFLDLGFSLSAIQKISLWRERKVYVARLIGAIIAIKLAALVMVGSIVVLYAATSVKYADHSAMFILFLLPLTGICFQPVWFFSGIERMRYITVFMVASKVISVLLILILVRDESDYLYVPVSEGVSHLVGAAIGFLLIRRVGYSVMMPSYRTVRYAIKITMGFFISRLSVTAYLGGGVFLLGLFATPAATATYALAERVYQAMQQVFYPIVQAIYPYMAKEKNVLLLVKVAAGMVLTAIIGASIGYFGAPFVLSAVFGKDWTSAIPVLNVFLVGIVVHVLTVMSGYPLAAVLDAMKVANTSVVLGAVVYVIAMVALLFLEILSPVAFAWIMVAAEFYVLLHRSAVMWPQAYRLILFKRELGT